MGVAKRAVAFALVALMAIGSVLMWLGVPLFWIWLASQLATSTQPSASLILLVMVGIVVSFVGFGFALGRLNVVHQGLTGRLPRRREQTMWLRSMRGERAVQREHGVLGTVMAISVSLALAAATVWFFLFARGGGI